MRPYLRDEDGLAILDQTALPHAERWRRLVTLADAVTAIRSMQVRGAPLIGVTAAYGVALALAEAADDAQLRAAIAQLAATRPTAINLYWALQRMQQRLHPLPPALRPASAWQEADAIAAADAAENFAIGQHGLSLLQALRQPERPLRLMTHCNAGWLATAAHGTALAPIYAAHEKGVPLFVWVSETRPRNQGLLTAWELRQAGIPHAVIADNAAGLLLQRGEVDAVIVGADRIAANGDVANKVGTYLKALAADRAGVPFYVAAPVSTLDFACPEGSRIPIESRDGDELRLCQGIDAEARPVAVRQLPVDSEVYNPAFDLTPAELVTALVTGRGVFPPDALPALFPESAP